MKLTQPTFWNHAGEIVLNTRREAARSIEPLKPNMLRQVYEFIVGRGQYGTTDEEISLALAMRESTARARRVELRDGGQVRDSLTRRRSKSGRYCVVWTWTGEPLR